MLRKLYERVPEYKIAFIIHIEEKCTMQISHRTLSFIQAAMKKR